MVKIAPSVLACDFSRFGEECRDVLSAGAEWLHFDVMDGVLVPNLSLGIAELASIKQAVDAFYDVHLMIIDPIRYVKAFADAGADMITFHVESQSDPCKTIQSIRDCDKQAGITLCPGTPVTALFPYLPFVDMVLVMTVEPGFGGQKFMPEMIPKIIALRDEIERRNLHVSIEVDGGIDPLTAPAVIAAGADILVAGSSIFKHADRRQAIGDLQVSVFK